jgi:hypothetical protein
LCGLDFFKTVGRVHSYDHYAHNLQYRILSANTANLFATLIRNGAIDACIYGFRLGVNGIKREFCNAVLIEVSNETLDLLAGIAKQVGIDHDPLPGIFLRGSRYDE